ncbi:hypothetical protein LO763_24955 [Glycomyces sp. A-F 0318]|nr:hypothetical protein [Glycomyces amatae]MCD0446873.1 hypothetical protein [Glycomyces amatae]
MDTLLLLFLAAVGFYVLYWTVRYAVRHALADADERRSGSGADGGSIES